MKKLLIISSLLIANLVCISQENLNYTINLNECGDDHFRVTLDVQKLKDDNNIYQFASTAPGTYQVMDIGRFVRNFKAFDKKGNPLKVEKISVNQFKLHEPKKIKKITYEIAETWDSDFKEHFVYKMCGTSLEDDHALINPHCVIGFPSGMQSEQLSLRLLYPVQWELGTALNKNSKGLFEANSYDHLIDSPFLLGRLSKASTTLDGTQIEIFTYSKTDVIKSQDLMNNMLDMLKAADHFLVDFPVDRYTFLYHFEDEGWGAWEHSFSSEYVYKENPLTDQYAASITGTAAHEFFHIITPLNIHSEIIEQFNFETPTPSQHLWLYEGVTEWASDILQFRGGIYTLEEYLQQQTQKLKNNDNYDPNYSLRKLALTSYTDEGQSQYPNIYSKGAIIGSLLDIRLLELSNGEEGLREVILELSKKYGQKRAFPEDQFFQLFAELTYPQITDFFNSYVKNAEPLPIKEYYSKLGINYLPEIKTGKKIADLGYSFAAPDQKIIITNLADSIKIAGLKEGDQLLAFDDKEVNLNNAGQMIGHMMQLPAGHKYTIKIMRDDNTITTQLTKLEKDQVIKHAFEVNKNASEAQVKLRESWMKNLPLK